jgi:hypothetical protein
MKTVTVYSSEPSATKIAAAFFNLKKLGIPVVLRPLQELEQAVAAGPQPRRRLVSLRAELEGITLQLVEIGERLEAHQNGAYLLDAGEENGLYAQRDALQARKRGIQGHLQAVKGGQDSVQI